MKRTRFQVIYRLPSSYLSKRLAVILLIGEIILGVAGYVIIEDYSVQSAIYMTVITISTVGFTEVHPLTPAGQLFTSIFILFNVGVFAYILAVFSYYVIQGELFKKMHANFIKSSIEKLHDHVIVCGYGRHGKEAAFHLGKHDMPYVIIEQSSEKIIEIQKSEEKILYIEDDATHDEALLKAGIKNARALISALADDSDNVFVVLSARALNPKINIISRAKDPRSETKLGKAGADHVILPEQIGGFYMATLVNKPGAIEFFSFITDEYRSDIGLEEISFDSSPDYCKYKAIKDLHIRAKTGANIIGYKSPDGHYHVNPSPDIKLTPNASFFVLGDREQIIALKHYLEEMEEVNP